MPLPAPRCLSAPQLKLPNNKALPLPPFGQGWFDNIYVDDEVSVMMGDN
jgi:hypothetical protein